MLIRILHKICNIIMYYPRKLHYKIMGKGLKNSDFTIIASDCFATFVYHNLGLRFNSPTINLFFSPEDFICFVQNLKGFLSVDLTEVHEHNRTFPVGELTYDGKTIRVEFMHYHSFEEARAKWNERKLRVNYSNLFIIQTLREVNDPKLVDAFQKLPYENKLLIAKENEYPCDCMVTHPIFSKKNYKPGEILEYKSWFSCKRYMDEIDYIGFLNRNCPKNNHTDQ